MSNKRDSGIFRTDTRQICIWFVILFYEIAVIVAGSWNIMQQIYVDMQYILDAFHDYYKKLAKNGF